MGGDGPCQAEGPAPENVDVHPQALFRPPELFTPALGVEFCAWLLTRRSGLEVRPGPCPRAPPSPSPPPLCAVETPVVICSKRPSLPACALDQD